MLTTSESITKLQDALAKAQASIVGATKDATNPHFKSQYATLASAWEAWQKAGPNYGLSVIQTIGHAEGDRVYVTTRLGHASGEWIQDSTPLLIGRHDMQGLGSAITYARRYALMAMVGLAPEDDDGNKAAASPAASAPPKKAPPPAEKPAHVTEAERIVKAVKKCGTVGALDRLEKDNEPALQYILEKSGETHAHVMSVLDRAHSDLTKIEQREAREAEVA